MKSGTFKNKYSTLNRSSKRMRSFRKVEGREEVLQVNEADRKFSLRIRQRDGQCRNCGSTLFLGCSHYFGRSSYATRYDLLNCITLCQECHEEWELKKEGVYKDFMIMWLGDVEFYRLWEKSRQKVSPYDSIRAFMKVDKALADIAY